jgi:hypothetical protein
MLVHFMVKMNNTYKIYKIRDSTLKWINTLVFMEVLLVNIQHHKITNKSIHKHIIKIKIMRNWYKW